jgi:hypothetical protein
VPHSLLIGKIRHIDGVDPKLVHWISWPIDTKESLLRVKRHQTYLSFLKYLRAQCWGPPCS